MKYLQGSFTVGGNSSDAYRDGWERIWGKKTDESEWGFRAVISEANPKRTGFILTNLCEEMMAVFPDTESTYLLSVNSSLEMRDYVGAINIAMKTAPEKPHYILTEDLELEGSVTRCYLLKQFDPVIQEAADDYAARQEAAAREAAKEEEAEWMNAPMGPKPACDHGLEFDEKTVLLINDRFPLRTNYSAYSVARQLTEFVRVRFPRLNGLCPKGCGFNGYAYASAAHFIWGEW